MQENTKILAFSTLMYYNIVVFEKFFCNILIRRSKMSYLKLSAQELEQEYLKLKKVYDEEKSKGLNLNMARGKPGDAQLELSNGILDTLSGQSRCIGSDGMDFRNYGVLPGIEECRKLFGEILEVDYRNVMVGGNSSLSMMFDTIDCMMTKPIVAGCKPWYEVADRKFLCPVPGYDRHFGITEYFGFKMIPVPMNENGPDMDIVEELVASDDTIKGMWCVPKYSNPSGVTYSDETVKRIAALKPAARDFRVMWDNAYCIHDITDTPDTLLNIVDECKKTGNEDLPVLFCSTSKITFPGAGVAAMAASDNNMKVFMERYKYKIISFDKMNMLRHVRYFKDYQGVLEHMKKHKEVLRPKFDIVLDTLERELVPVEIGNWTKPNGGYFVSIDVYEGTAKRVVQLCREAGVVLTDAGATYPYGNDPHDTNIRIAPTFPPNDELRVAMDIFCICVKLAACEKLLKK